MLYDTDYFWVVISKNSRFHHKGNTSYQHHIPLAEADTFSHLRCSLTRSGFVVTDAEKSIRIKPRKFCAPRAPFQKASWPTRCFAESTREAGICEASA